MPDLDFESRGEVEHLEVTDPEQAAFKFRDASTIEIPSCNLKFHGEFRLGPAERIASLSDQRSDDILALPRHIDSDIHREMPMPCSRPGAKASKAKEVECAVSEHSLVCERRAVNEPSFTPWKPRHNSTLAFGFSEMIKQPALDFVVFLFPMFDYTIRLDLTEGFRRPH